MRLNAYVLVADPAYLAASVDSYYPVVDRIVVSYDQDGMSWSGDPVPVEECFAELRHIDRDDKLDLQPARFSHPGVSPMECETRQRQRALALASKDADWVLQIDSDEVIPNLEIFLEALHRANRAAADAVEFPSRWIYARTRDGRFLEGCSRWWRPAAGYPGALAVRAGTKLRHARQADATLYRADFEPQNTDPWRLSDTPVDIVIPVDSAVLHFSWVRTPAEMLMKANISGHRGDIDWQNDIRKWRRHQRHPRIAAALTPLRRRGLLHPTWLRLVRLPVDPPTRVRM